jgi:stage II sporulation protein AB (anti-sigma F factor)
LDNQENYVKLEFYAKDKNVAIARLAAASFAGEAGFSLSDIEEIKVAVSEGISNAIIPGYCGDESRLVEMAMSMEKNLFKVEIKDEGIGIADIKKAMEPTYSSVAERMGLGFVFMESFMDTLNVHSSPNCGTVLLMTRRCPNL